MSKRSLLSTVLAIIIVVALLFGLWLWWDKEQDSTNQNETEQSEQTTTEADTDNDVEESPAPTTDYTSEKGVAMVVNQPTSDSTVESPLSVSGSVPGSWSFEASFPLVVTDSEGNVLGQAPAELHGDWMTEDLVHFTGTVDFDASDVSNGYLVLEKSNPSGLEENADELKIPVRFN